MLVRVARLVLLALLVALAASSTPPVAAQSVPATETITVLIDVTLPNGTRATGTLVARRTCGPTIITEGRFDGLLNGRQFTATGTVVERWLGNGREEVEVIATDITTTVLGRSPLRTVLVEQLSAGLVSVEGIPVAADQPVTQPCAGRTPARVTITNPGQGIQPIASLPNTAGAGLVLTRPAVLSGGLILSGLLLILLGRVLRPRRAARP